MSDQELQDKTTAPAQQHPADIADRLQEMATDDAVETLRSLSTELASEVLSELDEDTASQITAELTSEEISELLEELPHDEMADIAAELPAEQRLEVLSNLPEEEQEIVSNLMKYPPDSAGGIMTDEFIYLHADLTVEQAMNKLRWSDPDDDQEGVSYVYVVDEAEKLIGVVTIRDLVFKSQKRKLRDLVLQDVQVVHVDDDQEKVAQLFSQYHFLALPVVESDGRLVGMVEASQVYDIIQDEATEDMQLMVGLSGEENTFTPWPKSLSRRLPWLLVNLATAFLAAAVVGMFEGTIAKWTTLAVFLPIVAGQGGNAGMQTLTVIIRGMALGEISGKAGRKALTKETILGLLNGIAIGIVVGLIGYLWKGNFALGIIIALAMFLNMFAAALSGVLIPFALKAVKVDPALASSIFLTTVTDVAGFFFFLGLAALAMRFMGVA
ncbi:MAG: magnesium transporter [Verrucomicrobia bacterium]|nr:magnesium transporter [Kiritimatiellia bacterium]MCB1101239.1 magnesium transporter [Kiritimatiellia bacterium]MCP5488639.1 magnesium transporter [Verrucomicrobiota bacterium]